MVEADVGCGAERASNGVPNNDVDADADEEEPLDMKSDDLLGLLLPPVELDSLSLSFLLLVADEEKLEEAAFDAPLVPMDRSDGWRSLLEDVDDDDDDELPVKLSRELDLSKSRSLEPVERCLPLEW